MDTQEFEEKYVQLTPKLHEVLTQVLQGIPDTEIAENMGIQPATVRKHIERIYRILDLNSDFPEDRRSRRSDLFALFAQHKPEMLLSSPPFSAGGDPDSDVTEADNKIDSPPQNPFIPLTGMVDDPKLFFDREREIRDIFELLNSSSHVAVIGEKGIGKSSVLQAICREAESKLLQPREGVYLDLRSLENEDEFYMALCDRLKIPESKGYPLTRELNKKKRLLVMDKVEKLTEDGFIESGIASHLRGLAEGMDPPLRLIFSSNQSLNQLYKNQRITSSPFENLLIEVTLKPWDETTARAFIAQRLASTPVSFTEEEIAQIIAETGGHPQQLMERCYQLFGKKITVINVEAQALRPSPADYLAKIAII